MIRKVIKWTLITLGSILGLLILCIVIILVIPTPEQKASSAQIAMPTITATATPRPEPTATAKPITMRQPTPSPDPLLAVAERYKPPLTRNVTIEWHYGYTELVYWIPDGLSEQSILQDAVSSYRRMIQALYTADWRSGDNKLDRLTVAYETTFIIGDSGETRRHWFLAIKTTGLLVGNAPWESLSNCDVPAVVESFVVWQPLKPAWGELCP